MSISTEITVLIVLLFLVTAGIIVKLVLRSKLKDMDGFDGIVKKRDCRGHIVGSMMSAGRERRR